MRRSLIGGLAAALALTAVGVGGAPADAPPTGGSAFFVRHEFSLAPGQFKQETADCPKGTVVISGGFSQTGADGIVETAGPEILQGQNDYEVGIEDPNSPPDFRAPSSEQVEIQALCAPVGHPVTFDTSAKGGGRRLPGTLHRVERLEHINAGGGNSKRDILPCPAGTEIISGGFQQSQDQGVPIADAPTPKHDGYELFIYNPPSNPQYPAPKAPPIIDPGTGATIGRIGKPDDIRIVALCGEIGKPLVPGSHIIESSPNHPVRVRGHKRPGNLTRQEQSGEIPVGASLQKMISCGAGHFAISGGIVQNSYHGAIFANLSRVTEYEVDARNPQGNPLWSEPDTPAGLTGIAICAPDHGPVIPGVIHGG